MSAVLLLVDGAYTVDVMIYDNLGKFIASSGQSFGDCGELENPYRIHPTGQYASHIIWDQKDQEGKYVGSGVYIIKMMIKFADGRTKVKTSKQGIARSNDWSTMQECMDVNAD